jgi:RNA polymerase sigma-70 factor (ECF subfamily)
VTNRGASRQYLDVSGSDRTPDLSAFDAVYDQELDYVWRTLGRFGVAPEDLADAAHDVFVIVYRRWDEVDHTRSLRPWLFGVARKLAAMRRRKHREILSEANEPAGDDSNAFVQRDLVWTALGELSDERCEVLVLHDLEGHTGAEIAAQLEIPVNTVHSRLRLARADFAAAVRKHRGAP